MNTDLTLIDARRSARAAIKQVIESDIPEREKLAKCLNIGTVHCAATGDDSLLPEAIRNGRQAMIDSLPKYLARAKSAQKDKASGEMSLL